MRPRGCVRLAAFAGPTVVTLRYRLRARRGLPSVLASVAVLVLIAGCSTESDSDKLQTRPAATAAIAPAQTAQPTGDVVRLANPIGGLLTETGTGALVALDTSRETGTTLFVIDPATIARKDSEGASGVGMRTLMLPAPGVGLAQGKPGELLIPADHRIMRVDITSGVITQVPVDGDVRSVRYRDDGTLFIGTADGRVRELSPDGVVAKTVSGLASADALALTGDHVSVLDRRQTSLTQLDFGKDRLGLALRAGDGATNLITDPFGRITVTDTAGDELLVYTAGPLVLRQRFPVGSSPYALAYDQRSDTVWVTCTQSNEVVGFDLSTGIPKEVGRYPTVRQPNSVTIDERTGDLFVGSATGDGLQRIRADQRKKGQ
ncbi:YncE family protein [Nocardia sp. CA-107356]|uniref:YncE family protein n=1 Tax=Nocardia sp. CA-107356 TaxID=3239972 RepID=UPI003D8DD094